MALDWQPAGARARTREDGRDTWHSFSFGSHYDPANVGYAGLLAHNDDRLAPGSGYPDHAHTDLEIVTWVVSGVLVHGDDADGFVDLGAGTLQVHSAGVGIRHSEIADATSGPTRFVQAWVRPDRPGGPPERTVVAADPLLAAGGLVPLASGDGGGLTRLRAAGATLWVGRLAAGEALTLPEDPLQHLFVVAGRVRVAGGVLAGGDALRASAEPGHRLEAVDPSELLVWTFGG